MNLKACNDVLQVKWGEITNAQGNPTSVACTESKNLHMHACTQTEGVIVCPRIRGEEVAIQSDVINSCDSSTSMDEAPHVLDAQTQTISYPTLRHGRIPGKSVQTDITICLECGSQATLPRSRSQHTESDYERISIAVQAPGIDVSSRGCSARPDVKDKCVLADVCYTSIDAVWLGKASSAAALEDVKARFAEISPSDLHFQNHESDFHRDSYSMRLARTHRFGCSRCFSSHQMVPHRQDPNIGCCISRLGLEW